MGLPIGFLRMMQSSKASFVIYSMLSSRLISKSQEILSSHRSIDITAFAFAITHTPIWPLSNSDGNKLYVHDFCPHGSKSRVILLQLFDCEYKIGYTYSIM